MLACLACLLGDKAIQEYSTESLRAHKHIIVRCRREMSEQHGQRECNPALVVEQALQQIEDQD